MRVSRLLAGDKFVIDFSGQHFALQRSDIICIEAQSHYLVFHLGTIDDAPKLRAKISDVLPQLPPELFVQCHRSFIVNLLHIHRFTKDTVFLLSQIIYYLKFSPERLDPQAFPRFFFEIIFCTHRLRKKAHARRSLCFLT